MELRWGGEVKISGLLMRALNYWRQTTRQWLLNLKGTQSKPRDRPSKVCIVCYCFVGYEKLRITAPIVNGKLVLKLSWLLKEEESEKLRGSC